MSVCGAKELTDPGRTEEPRGTLDTGVPRFWFRRSLRQQEGRHVREGRGRGQGNLASGRGGEQGRDSEAVIGVDMTDHPVGGRWGTTHKLLIYKYPGGFW